MLGCEGKKDGKRWWNDRWIEGPTLARFARLVAARILEGVIEKVRHWLSRTGRLEVICNDKVKGGAMGWVSLNDEKIEGDGQETESAVEGSPAQMQNKDRNAVREMTAREDLNQF